MEPLVDGDSHVTDDGEMAELLNKFFCSVFTRENLDAMPEPEQLYTGAEPLTEAEFKEEDVKKKLTNLKASAAPGPEMPCSPPRVKEYQVCILNGG